MKKYLKLLVAGLVFVLAACGGGNDNSKPTPSSPKPSTPSVSTPTENIGETMSKIDAAIKGYVPEVVDGDITLPTSIEGYDIVISWHSQSPDVISTEGKYTKPLNDTTVILTATYEYKDSGVHKVEVKPTVYGYTDEEKLDLVKGEMSKPEIDATHTSFTLITENDLNATITWEVSGSEYATINENTFSLAEDAFLNGASFTLKATIELNEKTAEVIYEYEIAIDYSLRLEKAKAEIEKPELVDNKEITVPLTGLYDSTITWSANDEEVVIEEDKIILPARAEEWNLVITGTIANEEANDTLTFDYVVAADDGAIVAALVEEIEALPLWGDATLEDKVAIDAAKSKLDNLTDAQVAIFEGLETSGELTEKLESLLDKYIEIRGVVLSEEKATWEEVEVATGYEITFTDLGKTFTVATNEFVYADYGMPTDTKYNVEINVLTGDTTGYIGVGEAITIFGNPSELPQVSDPVITLNGTESFTWDPADYEGATAVRVYADGVLRREIPVELGFYSYRFNGIADSVTPVDKELVIQFVGNGTTHQSSNFYKVTASVQGAGFALNTPYPYFSNGSIRFASTDYNEGYEVRIDDFRSYYTEYGVRTNGAIYIPVEDLGLEAGTYTLKVKTMSDNGGTPSEWSHELQLTINEKVMEGPANVAYDNDTLALSWDVIEGAKFYTVEIPSTGYETIVTTNSFDLSLAELTNGTYDIEVSAYVFAIGDTTGQAIVDITKNSNINVEINISATKLDKPTNLAANYSEITWDAVENAVGYEVVINGQSYEVATNSFKFIENNLSMKFDYSVKVKALGATIADNSFFSEEIKVKYDLVNIATLANGALAEASTGDGLAAIDGNDASRWESEQADPQYITVTLKEIYTIYGLHVFWEGANAAEYNVEVSVDGVEWVKVYDYKTTPFQQARHDYLDLDEPVEAKYVRINGTKRGTQWGYSIFTLEVFTIEG